jgi:signal-transduction protein with cAMP-binding, CBS, and nucleotidyltransferase domain
MDSAVFEHARGPSLCDRGHTENVAGGGTVGYRPPYLEVSPCAVRRETVANMSTTLAQKKDILAEVRLFGRCRGCELEGLAAASTELHVSPGEVLCQEGEAGHELFVVVEGNARVAMSDREIAIVGPGSFFGEMALMDGGPRIATVTALTPMELLVLDRTEFRRLLGTRPALVSEVLAVMGERMRSIQRRLAHAPS